MIRLSDPIVIPKPQFWSDLLLDSWTWEGIHVNFLDFQFMGYSLEEKIERIKVNVWNG